MLNSKKIFQSLTTSIIDNCIEAKWVLEKRGKIKNFSNEPVKTLGTITAPVESNKNNWRTKNAQIVINGRRQLIGQYLFETLGIYINRQQAANRIRNYLKNRTH